MPAHADSVDELLSPGKVVEGHAKVESECAKCHKRFDKEAQPGLCSDCHKEVGKDFREKRGYHGRLEEEKPCKECHTDHKGRNAKIVIFDPDKFDHTQTDFKLKGGHLNEKVQCKDCHRDKTRFREAPSDCNACHKKDDKHKGGLGSDCAKCHVEKDWKTTSFDHDKTHFRLLGKHVDVKCIDCHIGDKFKDTPKQCNECHKKVDQEKAHKGRYGMKCETCHTDKGWKEIRFNHDTDTRYELRGKHRPAKCDSCHLPEKGAIYQNKLSNKCVACHKNDDQEKGHKGGLGDKCETCHSEKEWKTSTFNHDKDTKYPLRDKHKSAKCDTCHKGGISGKNVDLKVKLEKECVACHKTDDQEKGHKGGLGDKCETCHSEKEWKTSTFNHDKDTKYPLRDKHKSAKCDTCHKGGISGKNVDLKVKLEKVCVACHKTDDQEKGHKGGLGDKCETCHTEKEWKTSTFNHDKDTKYPLRDKHKSAKCDTCHKGGISGKNVDLKVKLEKECVACHKKNDQEKGHKGRYGNKCETCHSEKEWKTSTFNHDRDTKYKLRDKHLKPKCDDCHLPAKGPIYQKKLETQCIACHKKDDKHNGQLGNKCESCHNEKGWQDAPYDHAKARFQLTGIHIKVECKKCHLTPAFHDASSTCNGCHEKEDVHKKRLGPKCETCHNTRSWKSWDFNHDRTKFKLDGAHKKSKCVDCHREPVGTKFSTPQACGGCHFKEDVHNSGFGQQCGRCHTTSDWRELFKEK